MELWKDPIAIILGMCYANMVYGAINKGPNPNIIDVYNTNFNNEIMGSIKLDGAAKASFNSLITDRVNMNFIIE